MSDNQIVHTDGGVGNAIGAVGALLIVGAVFCAMAHLVLFPAASAIVLAIITLLTLIFSAAIHLVWHDPSPYFLFGMLYVNWIALIPASLVGAGAAWIFTGDIESGFSLLKAYRAFRHMWRIGSPACLIAGLLIATQADTGLTNVGLWLIPMSVATALHFSLRNHEVPPLSEWFEG